MERVIKFLKSETPVTWLFYGDSITHGAAHTNGHRDYSQIFNERVRHELGRPNDTILNTAISGNTTKNLLEGFDNRVGRFSPDFVFLMIGMNDCSDNNDISLKNFTDNLAKLCSLLDGMGTLCVLQTTCPILPNTSPDRINNFDDYMQTIRDIAIDKNLPLIDHTKYWRENPGSFYLWMSNEFHPNEYGHRVFAKLIFEQLGIFDPASKTCGLFIS